MKRILLGCFLMMGCVASSEAAWPVVGYVQVQTSTVQAGGFNVQTGQVGTFTDTGLAPNQCVQTGLNGLLQTSGSQCSVSGGGGGSSALETMINTVHLSSPTPTLNIIGQGVTGSLAGSTATFTFPFAQVATDTTTLGINSLTNSSATATYLSQLNAASTYLTQSSATATYLQSLPAANTYLTQSSATVTYCHANGVGCTNPSTTLSGDVTGSGTGSIATTVAAVQTHINTITSSLTVTGAGGLNVAGAGGVTIASIASGLQCVHADASGHLSGTGLDCSGTGNFINNTSVLQAGSTFYVSSGTVAGQLTAGTFVGNGSGLTGLPPGMVSGATYYAQINPANAQSGQISVSSMTNTGPSIGNGPASIVRQVIPSGASFPYDQSSYIIDYANLSYGEGNTNYSGTYFLTASTAPTYSSEGRSGILEMNGSGIYLGWQPGGIGSSLSSYITASVNGMGIVGTNISPSNFLATDSGNNIVSLNPYTSTNSWTGGNSFSSYTNFKGSATVTGILEADGSIVVKGGGGTTTLNCNGSNMLVMPSYQMSSERVYGSGSNIGIGVSAPAATLDVGGGIYAEGPGISSFTASAVTMSTLTVTSSTTLQNVTINGTCTGTGCGGTAAQIFMSSATSSFTTNSGSFVVIPISSFTVTLHKATNKWIYMVSGDLYVASNAPDVGLLSVFRDATNLGTTSGTMDINIPGLSTDVGASMIVMDAPGDTLPHTYTVQIRSLGPTVGFSDNATAYYTLLEIPQ